MHTCIPAEILTHILTLRTGMMWEIMKKIWLPMWQSKCSLVHREIKHKFVYLDSKKVLACRYCGYSVANYRDLIIWKPLGADQNMFLHRFCIWQNYCEGNPHGCTGSHIVRIKGTHWANYSSSYYCHKPISARVATWNFIPHQALLRWNKDARNIFFLQH